MYELATYLQSTAGTFHYGHAEGLSERCVEEDMTLHQNSTNIFVLQSTQQTHSVGRKGMDNVITEVSDGGSVVHVGAVFPTQNTVVVAPTYYKQSIPVNTGNFVMQQHSNMSTEDPHTALTQAMEENLVELQ